MTKKKIKIIATRTYTKTTEVVVEVDENMTMKDISDFVAFDTQTDNKIEEGIAQASLNGQDTDYQYLEVK